MVLWTAGMCVLGGMNVSAQVNDAGAGPRIGAYTDRDSITCDEPKTMRYQGIKIEASGIKLSGGCRLVLVDSIVEVDGWAAELRGDSVLMLRYSILKGRKGAFDLHDTSRLRARNSVLEGSIRVSGEAEYDDRGGNSRGMKTAANAGTKGELTSSEALRCVGRETLVIESRSIEVEDRGLAIQGDCDVKIVNSRIKAKDRAIVVQGSPKVVIIDSEISAENRAFVLVGNPSITIRGSRIIGGFHKVGKPQIQDDGGNAYQ